ncbi:MAG: hypothetical protein LBT70_01145, partial [Holosporaceae bacterium]|nr:hypothetical protein [Holosporaceae bacterium]
ELGNENYGAHVSAHVNKRFGREIHGHSGNSLKFSATERSRTNYEYSAGIHLRNKDKGTVSLEASHMTGGTKGFSVKLNVSINI